MRRLFATVMIVMGLNACAGQYNERVQILADYGVVVEDGISTTELRAAMAKMLPDEGSVTALETKFKYIFEHQPEVLLSLSDEFGRYHKIESDPVLQMEEIKRLHKDNEDNELFRFWLDQLATVNASETPYVIYTYEDCQQDILPYNLILEAKHGFVDGQLDLAKWYLKRKMKGDTKKAYYWYLRAQSLGHVVTEELAQISKELSEDDIREVEGKIK